MCINLLEPCDMWSHDNSKKRAQLGAIVPLNKLWRAYMKRLKDIEIVVVSNDYNCIFISLPDKESFY